MGTDIPSCGGDRCAEGDLQRDCSDGDVCGTQDVCDPLSGCTSEAVPIECADGSPCSSGGCDAAHGCVHEPRPTTFACDHDADRCTEWGSCDGGGACVGEATAVECPFETCGNTSTCNPVFGCSYAEVCNDGVCGPDDLCACGGAGGDCDGSDPTAPYYDGDGDGVPDVWEQIGLDSDCNGTADYLIGGDEVIPSTWLELDYMVDTDHTHEPLPGVIDLIGTVFDQQGLELLVDLDEAIDHADALSFSGIPPSDPSCSDWVAMVDVKAAHFDVRRRPVYRYGVFGHRPGGCGGFSGFSLNSTLSVTLGAFDGEVGTFEEQAGTLLHEIGHTFGLNHSGYGAVPERETNYQSSMSYLYQLTGLYRYPQATFTVDWSHEQLSHDEASLDEVLGLDSTNDPDNLYFAVWACPSLALGIANPIGPVDWDCDGSIDLSPVAAHLDDELLSDNVVEGRDDWATLDYRFQCSPAYSAGAGASLVDPGHELSYADALAAGLLDRPQTVTVDPLPSCTSDPLPADGTGEVQVAVLGSAGLDVTDIVGLSVRISSAVPTAQQVTDADGDTIDDLVVEVWVSDLVVGDPPAIVLEAVLTDGTRLLGGESMSWVSTHVDGDADGVPTACDLCPTAAGGAASPDGCP